MRNRQVGRGVPNSPAIPLSSAVYGASFRCRRVGEITFKLLIGLLFLRLRGRVPVAESGFLPAIREKTTGFVQAFGGGSGPGPGEIPDFLPCMPFERDAAKLVIAPRQNPRPRNPSSPPDHRSSSPAFELAQPANRQDLQQGSRAARRKDGGIGCRLGECSA